jgi:hypothetical protein
VAIVRGGGPPLTQGMFNEPMYAEIAERLRNYNFEVLEKDVTGQFAQMAMAQGMPTPPDPEDSQIKDAVWVVMPTRPDMRSMQMPSPALGEKLRQHLEPQSSGQDLAVDGADAKLVRSAAHKFTGAEEGDTLIVQPGGAWQAGPYKIAEVKEDGAALLDNSPAPAGTTGGKWQEAPGSAMVLFDMTTDALGDVLKDYGVEAATDKVIVHEPIEPDGDAPAEDFIEQARRLPFIFVLNDYGDHPIVAPLRSLDGAFVTLLPVSATTPEGDKAGANSGGLTVTPILPIPQDPPSWAESDTGFLFNRRGATPEPPTFDSASDTAPPLYAGAVVEKAGGARLVVIGSQQFAIDPLLRLADPKLAKSKLNVARFPGNGELFTNSIFWLAGNEKMIALSPSAMETPRIADIGPGALGFWRVGVFLIGLPLMVLVAGFLVYQSRRG